MSTLQFWNLNFLCSPDFVQPSLANLVASGFPMVTILKKDFGQTPSQYTHPAITPSVIITLKHPCLILKKLSKLQRTYEVSFVILYKAFIQRIINKGLIICGETFKTNSGRIEFVRNTTFRLIAGTGPIELALSLA